MAEPEGGQADQFLVSPNTLCPPEPESPLCSDTPDLYKSEQHISRSGVDTIPCEPGGECARIIDILRAKRAYLEETYHVGSIGVLGSCQRGEEHERSDVEILVEFSRVPGIFGFLRSKIRSSLTHAEFGFDEAKY